MTCPTPILNSKGLLRSREESNFFPLVSVPVSSACGEREEGGGRREEVREEQEAEGTRKLGTSGV